MSAHALEPDSDQRETRRPQMYQLRVYTLRSPEALAAYQDIWTRHIPSLARHRISVHGIWTAPQAETPQLFALVSYANSDDPQERDKAYMTSSDFQMDMTGFAMSQIVSVTSTLLMPTSNSPLR